MGDRRKGLVGRLRRLLDGVSCKFRGQWRGRMGSSVDSRSRVGPVCGLLKAGTAIAQSLRVERVLGRTAVEGSEHDLHLGR